MPYLLFLKKQQNLKLSSAANYRWRFKGYKFSLYMYLHKKVARPLSAMFFINIIRTKIVSEYDQEIPQSQTTDNPMVRGHSRTICAILFSNGASSF